LALVNAFDFELLAGLDTIPLADFGGKNNLAFARNGGVHEM